MLDDRRGRGQVGKANHQCGLTSNKLLTLLILVSILPLLSKVTYILSKLALCSHTWEMALVSSLLLQERSRVS